MNLRKFEDILIDLDDVRLLAGSTVVFKDGEMHDVGVKAADAMRALFNPARIHSPEPPNGIRGKAKERHPSKSSN